jgi:membrane-bound metal-dependent hydrolase YbcI (DUF457 family)
MNTPAHLIFGAVVFGRPGVRHATKAAVLGSLLPDLSLYLLAGVSIHVLGIPPARVFAELYFSPAWQAVFAIDNSFPLWGLLMAVALWQKWAVVRAFAGGGLLHLGFDFLLHNEDARRQFWPLSDWVFRSPFSYYDPARHGEVIGALEILLCLMFSVILWRRYPAVAARVLIALAILLELLPGLLFGYIL